mgnify:CR=1 FL=1
MATPVQIPKLGNTVEECLIIEWRKKKGDHVSQGEIVAEIETDKATFELEAAADGVLLDIFFNKNDLAPIHTTVCVIGEPGENIDEFVPQLEQKSTAISAQVPDKNQQEQKLEIDKADPISKQTSASDLSSPGKWSPRARTFGRERNFFPQSIQGSGPGGRILEQDVLDAWLSGPRLSSLARSLVQDENRTTLATDQHIIYAGDLSAPAKTLSRIRTKSAKKLYDSLQKSAQYTLHSSADATQLLHLRQQLKQHSSKSVQQININVLVLLATIQALKEFPQLNAEFIDGKIYENKDINLCFACDTPQGLVVPVIHKSQNLTPEALAARVKTLAQQAEAGALTPDDLAGGTLTVSNLGNYGIESFTPILNAPQVALLGINAIQLKPVRVNGEIQFVDYIGFSLTLDHQVIDGAPGAQFLQRLCEIVAHIDKYIDLKLE